MLSSIRVSLLLFPVLLAVLFRPLTSHSTFHASNRLPSRVLLVTAHPDDECMFFAPTVLALVAQLQIEVYSLCLSTGDADGLGNERVEELGKSLDVLGVDKGRRWVLDEPSLKDNFTAAWDAQTIAHTVMPYVQNNQIETILTFDYGGISSHPNHVSIPIGVSHLLTSPSLNMSPVPRAYTLITVPTFTKYTGPPAALLAKFDLLMSSLIQSVKYYFSPTLDDPSAGMPVFVSGGYEYAAAVKAMRQHRTQLVWFRWLYIAFSRYMWVNEWIEVQPAKVRV